MARFHLRSIYDENEPTVGEGIMRGVQGGLDWYAQRRETARQEGNTIGAAGGEKLPDAPRPSIRDRLRTLIHPSEWGNMGGMGQPPLRPTGTFAPTSYPGEGHMPGDFAPESYPGEGQQPGPAGVNGGIAAALGSYRGAGDLSRVVQPTPPVGALPPTPRLGIGVPQMTPAPPVDAPTLATDSPSSPARRERTFEYQGSDGARYRVPQTGERERENQMLEYENRATYADRLSHQHQAEQISALVAGGMDPAEARARVLNNVVRYDDTFGQQRAGSLTFDERERLERLKASLRLKVSNGTATSADRARLRDLQERRQDLAERKFETGNDRAAAQAEMGMAGIRQRGVVTDPMDRQMMTPEQQRENSRRQAQVDEQLGRAATSANRARNRTASEAQVKARIGELRKPPFNITDKARLREQLQAEGYPVR